MAESGAFSGVQELVLEVADPLEGSGYDRREERHELSEVGEAGQLRLIPYRSSDVKAPSADGGCAVATPTPGRAIDAIITNETVTISRTVAVTTSALSQPTRPIATWKTTPSRSWLGKTMSGTWSC